MSLIKHEVFFTENTQRVTLSPQPKKKKTQILNNTQCIWAREIEL